MTSNNGATDLGQLAKQAVADYAARREPESQVTLSNGIVLKLKPVAEEPIRRAVLAIPLPEPPMVKLDGIDTEEPNPDDPEYEEALKQAQFQRTQAGFRVATILGTECKKAPPGHKPDGDKWMTELRVADPNIEIDTSSAAARYAEWLYLYALADPMDRTIAGQSALMFSFVEVAELSQAIQFFRDIGERRAADVSADDGSADADRGFVPGTDTGVDRGDGGTGDGSGGDDPVADVDDAAAVGEGEGASVEASP